MRETLYTSLRQIHKDKTNLKDQIQRCNLFKELNEGFFKNKTALHFQQLSFLAKGLLQMSTLDTETFVFVNSSESKAEGFIEQLVW